jgi:pyruvate dehydrogenase E2 component (dihydrolipoamide acetyltransferase)
MGRATRVIMPVLGMSQDTGRLIRWLKKEGERVEKGEPLMEVETDKATVEIESPATGILSQVVSQEGDEIPVTQVMAVVLEDAPSHPEIVTSPSAAKSVSQRGQGVSAFSISPLAARIAAEHQLDIGQIKPSGRRIEKADVLKYLASDSSVTRLSNIERSSSTVLASPKARCLAAERGIDLNHVIGSGPDGAVLADDILSGILTRGSITKVVQDEIDVPLIEPVILDAGTELPMSAAWGRMIERLSSSWPATPHFYLIREVNASRLICWREIAQKQTGMKITYTDLLVKLTAAALCRHPQTHASFRKGKIFLNSEANICLATATQAGLLTPVIRGADKLKLIEISKLRLELIERARAGRLSIDELQGGTFTISNLGMYGIDAFNAMINPGQAAILAVGRITDRVSAVNGQVTVQPMMTISASFDHRIVDGVGGAQFLKTLCDWIEEPVKFLDQYV